MQHPDFICQLYGLNDTERIAPKRQGDFQYTGAEALKWLGDISLAALGRNRLCGETDGLGTFGEALELMQRSLDPRKRTGLPCFSHQLGTKTHR